MSHDDLILFFKVVVKIRTKELVTHHHHHDVSWTYFSCSLYDSWFPVPDIPILENKNFSRRSQWCFCLKTSCSVWFVRRNHHVIGQVLQPFYTLLLRELLFDNKTWEECNTKIHVNSSHSFQLNGYHSFKPFNPSILLILSLYNYCLLLIE